MNEREWRLEKALYKLIVMSRNLLEWCPEKDKYMYYKEEIEKIHAILNKEKEGLCT